jgi:hypothetical protein
MSSALESRLRSFRPMGRENTLESVHPFQMKPVYSGQAPNPKYPAGFSDYITNKLPNEMYSDLSCKFEAEKRRGFQQPLQISKPLPPRSTEKTTVIIESPTYRPKKPLRLNEISNGISFGGKKVVF